MPQRQRTGASARRVATAVRVPLSPGVSECVSSVCRSSPPPSP
ncbi:hypothetical protein [Lysobacter gummosus]